jgi:hypothetical protein
MQKTIFTLRGRSNIGKTTTIKEVYRLLKEKHPNLIKNELILPKYPQGDEDIKVIIAIDEIKIGIESQGDPGSRLQESLKDFVEENCTIILCVARTRGKTNDLIEVYSNLFKIVWIRKEIDKQNKDECNQKQAIEIIKKIENVLKNATNIQDM